jgi:hypothetical protein
MVKSVREVYDGAVTYDYHYSELIQDFDSAATFWEDSGLDVIGISAYFPMADASPTAVISKAEFEVRWEEIFRQYLLPLQTRNPGKTILFTEFGYVDSLAAPYRPADVGADWDEILIDANGNELDDGQEMQANIISALFKVMDRHPGILSGTFLWDNWMASNSVWKNSSASLHRNFSVRGKLSENVIKQYYGEWLDQP